MARNTDIEQIGNIYITPVDGGESKKIPFEFNPQIQESGQSARYQAISVLSRLGDLQSYINTDSLSVTITTKYFATALTNEDAHILDSWMSGFTLVDLQNYELLFRSLTLPDFPAEDSSVSSGYRYVRPPYVRIIMGRRGNVDLGSTPYSSILTYPNQIVQGRLKSAGGFRNYRTFVTTGVTINKDLDETPSYLDDNGFLVDTHGFEVQLNLIEVVPSYSDILPTFNDYYSNVSLR